MAYSVLITFLFKKKESLCLSYFFHSSNLSILLPYPGVAWLSSDRVINVRLCQLTVETPTLSNRTRRTAANNNR